MIRSMGMAFVLVGILFGPSQAGGQTRSEVYAAACRQAIGDIPSFSCGNGVIVPITVDGSPAPATKGMNCDRPALLSNGPDSDGQCVPHSRILSLSTPYMQVAVMCRQKKIRPAAILVFDEIDVVAHNPTSGATCWFQATGQNGKPVDGAAVPSPTAAPTSGYWTDPATTVKEGCGNCHDSGPFVYSPFVGQVWSKMPADPFGPYFHVDPAGLGFDKWPTAAFFPRDNTCLACHRIGTQASCGNLTRWMTGRAVPEGANEWARRYPGSHGMPPLADLSRQSWNEIYAASVDQILSCCEKPEQPACRRTDIWKMPK
ncbi:MAG: hypothetical protein HQ465_01935 [Rhodospirillales bacterium]|nr:hypothetical protein [Rhodospirillales bacterium]